MIKISNESELLIQEIRKKIIEGFDDAGNQQRKSEAFKAYECLKDKTIHYVYDLLLKQFDSSTVNEMQYAMANVSILRKVIEKLAKVYSNGVKRTMDNESDTAEIEAVEKLLDLNAVMHKANRYFRTFKNTLVYVRPMKVENQFAIKAEALPPFLYDAIENPDNPEEAMCIVLSDYKPSRKSYYAIGDAALAGRGVGIARESAVQAMGSDEDTRQFVWWSKSYHFTTNAKGEIINAGVDSEIINPVSELPFVILAGDQDGTFWAEGGNDLVDAGVKINVSITNVEHVAISQGYGQLFMTGSHLPKSVKVGPNHCVQLEHEKDDATPTVGYLNSNPPVDQLRSLIEMRVALMLSTNNLSTSGFATSLKGGQSFASGIAMMIDKSESVEDVGEQAKIFIKKEPKVWGLVGRWHEVYQSRGLLIEDFSKVKMPKELETIQIAFNSSKPILGELDELAIIEKRKTLGLNTQVELIMRDDPSLTEEQAREKLEKIKEEKQANAEAFGTPDNTRGENGNQGEESGGVIGQDSDNAKPNGGLEASGSDKESDQE